MPIAKPRESKKTPGEYDTPEESLQLTCKECGKTAVYEVGKIMLDVKLIKMMTGNSFQACYESLKKVPWETVTYFSAYIECKYCGAGANWQLPSEAREKLAALVLEDVMTKAHGRVIFGQPQMFDGTVAQNGFVAVQHLKKCIAADPGNSFLWSRLGNSYVNGGRIDLSGPAFEKAAELDPDDPETHHSLGLYWKELGEDEKAARCFHMVMRKCRNGRWRRKDLSAEVVIGSVECLWEYSQESHGAISVFPPASDDLRFPEAERLQPFAVAVPDLSSTESRYRLGYALLGQPNVKLQRAHSDWAGATASPHVPTNSISPRKLSAKSKSGDRRKKACPCGSGKKYGHCCGKR